MSYASDALIDALGRDVDSLERENGQLKYENAELRALCRDMYLIIGVLDARGSRIEMAGKTADWRTLEERYEALSREGVV